MKKIMSLVVIIALSLGFSGYGKTNIEIMSEQSHRYCEYSYKDIIKHNVNDYTWTERPFFGMNGVFAKGTVEHENKQVEFSMTMTFIKGTNRAIVQGIIIDKILYETTSMWKILDKMCADTNVTKK